MTKIYLFYKNRDGANTFALKHSKANRHHTKTIFAHESCYSALEAVINPTDICVFTHGLPTGKEKKGIWINTWHGFPLKRMGLLDANKDQQQITKNTPWNLFDYWLSYGAEYEKRMQEMIGIDDRKFIRTAIPRLELVRKKSEKSEDILLCPTFRTSSYRMDGNPQKLISFYGKLISEFNSVISPDTAIYIKAHPNELNIFQSLTMEHNIKILPPQNGDFYQHIHKFGTIVTDYSSLWVDLINTDVNLIFALPDHDEYVNSRGLYSGDYAQVLPGLVLLSDTDLNQISTYGGSQQFRAGNIATMNHADNYKGGSEKTWDFISSLFSR